MRSPLTKTLLTIATMAALSSPSVAPARTTYVRDASGTMTARISYADLDLSSAEGQSALKKRVASAVTRICRRPGSIVVDEVACRNNARRDAGPQQLAAVQGAQVRLAMVTPRP